MAHRKRSPSAQEFPFAAPWPSRGGFPLFFFGAAAASAASPRMIKPMTSTDMAKIRAFGLSQNNDNSMASMMTNVTNIKVRSHFARPSFRSVALSAEVRRNRADDTDGVQVGQLRTCPAPR